MSYGSVFTFVALALCATTAVGAEPEIDTSSLGVGTKAEINERINPNYPRSELKRGAEGWVQLSYVISPTGTVSDVVVKDIVGPESFGTAAMEAVKQWTFKPATWGGTPVEQCSNDVIVKFAIETSQPGGRPRLIGAYREIGKLLEANQLDEARGRLDEVLKTQLNMYEFAFFSVQYAELARRRGDRLQEVNFLRQAATGDDLLGRKANRGILQRLYISETEAGLLADAMKTFEKLKADSRDIDDWAAYEKMHADAIALKEGNRILKSEIVLSNWTSDAQTVWAQTLLKRSIEFGELEGEFGNVEFRCERRYLSDRLSANKNWTLPESWGECAVYLYGKPGSRLNLYEVPVALAKSPPA